MPPGRASCARRANEARGFGVWCSTPDEYTDVERACLEARTLEIGLDELHAIEPEAARRLGAERERRPRQIGADDHAIGARQEQAHLAGSASDLDDPRIAGNRPIDQARKRAALGTRPQRLQAVVRRIAWKWRALVEAPHRVGALVAGQSQGGNPVEHSVASAALAARPVRSERPGAGRAGEQLADGVHPQKIA